jgi:hypothetical protein
MATGDTASDLFSRSRNTGVPGPEDVPPAVVATGTTSTCWPRADGTLRSWPSSQRSAVQKQEEISKCRRR